MIGFVNRPYCCFFSIYIYFFFRRNNPQWARASSFTRFLDHTQRRTTVGRTPLDEWSARRRDLYLTTRSTHNRQTSMPTVRFEPTISAGERPQTYALDRAATGTGFIYIYIYIYIYICRRVLGSIPGHWGFFPGHPTVPCALGSTQPLKMSTRIFLGVKTAGA